MLELGQDEHKILRFIERFQGKFGRTPTYEEIMIGTGMSSKDHVYRDVKKLERRGHLRITRGISRGITLLHTADGYPITASGYSVPLLGIITAGQPIPVPDPNAPPLDWVEVTRSMIADAEGVFAVKVRGNSMIDALINDGDTVLLKREETARNGDLVAVRLKSDPTNVETTLKRFYRVNGHVELKPENPILKPIFVRPEEVEIQGTVLCVIRNVPNSQSDSRNGTARKSVRTR